MSQATSLADLSEKFCAASRSAPHIFVVPVAVFEQKVVECDDGESTLRTAEPDDDPGYIVFNIDPHMDRSRVSIAMGRRTSI